MNSNVKKDENINLFAEKKQSIQEDDELGFLKNSNKQNNKISYDKDDDIFGGGINDK